MTLGKSVWTTGKFTVTERKNTFIAVYICQCILEKVSKYIWYNGLVYEG